MCASVAMRLSSLRLEPYVGKGDGASGPLKAREIELLRIPWHCAETWRTWRLRWG